MLFLSQLLSWALWETLLLWLAAVLLSPQAAKAGLCLCCPAGSLPRHLGGPGARVQSGFQSPAWVSPKLPHGLRLESSEWGLGRAGGRPCDHLAQGWADAFEPLHWPSTGSSCWAGTRLPSGCPDIPVLPPVAPMLTPGSRGMVLGFGPPAQAGPAVQCSTWLCQHVVLRRNCPCAALRAGHPLLSLCREGKGGRGVWLAGGIFPAPGVAPVAYLSPFMFMLSWT